MPTAVQAAEQKLSEAAARLAALRKMYAKEIGPDASMSGL